MNIYKSAYQIAHGLLAKYKREEVTVDIIQKEISNIFKMPGYDDLDVNELIVQLESDFGIFDYKATQLLSDEIKPWIYKTDIDYKYWSRYESFLRVNKPFFPISGMDDKTTQILDNCHNPEIKGIWDRRGMVVGNVQSGKTANYAGLINKALDSGYKIIIVIAGTYNTLRAQTQERIDEAVIGRKSVDLIQRKPTNKYGVGNFSLENTKPVYAYTSTPYLVREDGKAIKHGDFDINKARELNVPIDGPSPTILVIKKNKTILENVITWLSQHCNSEIDGFKKISDVPLLVIDDEADSASVNSGDEYDVRTINKLIRTLINLFNQSSFIGYTATPYANLFIPENWIHELSTSIKGRIFQIGPDLFPKHFIVNIHPPSNYIGASQIFGFENVLTGEKKEPLDLIRIVNDQEPCFPIKINRNNKDELPEDISDFPNSLKIAIKSFIISCAIRRHRGQIKVHNSMLVHVALYVKWIDRVAWLINDLIHDYKNQIKYEQGNILDDLQNLFEEDYLNTTINVKENIPYSDSKIQNCNWLDLKKNLKNVVERIEVRAIHGRKKGLEYDNIKELNYDDYEHGLYVIAVGGNKLARGITLEGLTVSYFLRTSKMYDTLMQMGRWFGYRPGYVDLCRLYTTEQIRLWYRHIAMASEDMRADFDEMVSMRMRPDQYQLKVMSHPGMLSITSASKMKEHDKLLIGYSGKLIQTYSFSKSNIYLQNNFNGFNYLVSNLSKPEIKYSNQRISELFWRNVNSSYIIEFITSFNTDQPIRSDTISGYILNQNKNGILKNWDVAIIANSNISVKIKRLGENPVHVFKQKVTQNQIEIGLPVRNMIDIGNYVEVGGRKMSILDKRARMIGLNIEDKSPSEDVITGERSKKQQPLLVIYPIDPRIIFQNKVPIIGWGLIFPRIENEEAYEYALRPIPELINELHENDDQDDED